MPSANKFEWPQGEPLFEVSWRTVSESLAGNGIVGNTDFEVTATANAMEIQVAAGTAFYVGSEYTLGTADVHTLTAADSTYDRWDTVYFDTATSTSGVRAGTAETNPEPPDIQADEMLLAIVYVPATASDVTDSNIHNWRGKFSNEAEEVHFDDPSGFYSATNVEAALQNAIDTFLDAAGDSLTGTLDVSAGAGSTTFTPLSLGTNPGAFDALIDATVDSNDAAGTEESYSLNLDGNEFLKLYAESDGAGGIQNARLDITNFGFNVGVNPGAFGSVLDAVVDGTPTAGTEESYTFTMDGSTVAKVYGEADGAGGVQNTRFEVNELTGSGNSAVALAQGANFKLKEATNIVVDTVSTVPGTVTAGRAVYDTSTDELLIGDSAGSAYQRPLSRPNVEEFSSDESGTIKAANSGIMYVTNVPDGASFDILQAGLMLADGQAAPSGLDMVIATLDNTGGAAVQTTAISGDGTVQDDVTGSPVASYSNVSGSAQTTAILIDNGNFNAGTGSDQSIIAVARGEVNG